MTNILDDIPTQQKLDQDNVYGSVLALPRQCLHAWQDTQNLTIPPHYKRVNKIIMTGMGGSGLGARIIQAVFGPDLPYPLLTLNDYDLPAWADEKTLVICSSFSGTTEETISTAKQAQAKKCPWMAISSGCALDKLAQKCRVPAYKIKPLYNPSCQPRMALGYSIIGQLVMLSRVGLIKIISKTIDSLAKTMNSVISQNQQEILLQSNPAKQIAQKFYNKQVICVAARHLTGAGHTFKNQLNENSKTLSHRHDIPELNHHLMEGLRFPASNRKDVIFFFADSDLYPARIKQRFNITQEVVKKNKIDFVSWQASATTNLAQNFELIQFGSFVTFYLAMLYGINPSAIPWVDYFKTRLGQSLGQWK